MSGARILACGVAMALAAAPVVAQRPISNGARISGVIQIDDTTHAPLRGAIVTISAPELNRPRSTITDAAGAFAFANLPAGRFALTATKVPFLTMAYGGVRPGRQGTSIRLAANQDMKDLLLRLPRGGVITGTLRDHAGAPVEGVTVSAVRPSAPAQNSLSPQLPAAATDNRGVYRIFGLMPGDYVVAATFSSVGSGGILMPSTNEIDRQFAELGRAVAPPIGGAGAVPGARPADAPPRPPGYALAPTFFPGTTNAADASIVTVASGEERSADFMLGPVRAGVIEGVLRTGDGSALPDVLLSLDQTGPQLHFNFGSGPMLSRRPTAADGRFRFDGVIPGKYFLSAMATTRGAGANGTPAATPFAVADLLANGDDLTGLTLTLELGTRLSGSVKFDGTNAPPAELSKIRLTMVSNRPSAGMSTFGITRPQTAATPIAANGSFEFVNLVPGAYLVSPLTLGGGWVLQSAIVNGKDTLDLPVEVSSGGDLSGAVFTFSDKRTELTGALRTANNAPATEYFVVTFPTDQSLWKAPRRIQSARPGDDGMFSIANLPPGEYYLAALTDVTAEDLKEPSFLSQIVPGAIKVTIADGEKKTQDLKIGR